MKIGVTANLINKSLFSNGVNQNALYLAKLLNNCGYITDIICAGTEEQLNEINSIIEDIECIDFNKSKKNKYDILITVGLQISKKDWNEYKLSNNDIKLVSYKCGNEFFFEMESIIFNKDTERYSWNYVPVPDQIWSIPQMEDTNLDYYSFSTTQKKSTVVPFIWDPMSIERHANVYNCKLYDHRKIRNIGIFEPNASFMKNAIIPVFISEDFYRKNKEHIDIVRIFSGLGIKDNKRLLRILKDFELFKDTKISMEARHNTISMLDQHVDVIVSWQMENNLNYLYLDAAWFGYPVLHNANLCKDVGYYYDKNNIFQASEKLSYIIENHSTDKKYLDKNRNIIKRYMPENKNLQKDYITLIENLISGEFKKFSYNCKNNSISNE